jgi:hypothetical protein
VCDPGEQHGGPDFCCADCGTKCDGVAGNGPGGTGCFCAGCGPSGISGP